MSHNPAPLVLGDKCLIQYEDNHYMIVGIFESSLYGVWSFTDAFNLETETNDRPTKVVWSGNPKLKVNVLNDSEHLQICLRYRPNFYKIA
jgi:hypothetical protein